MCVSVGDVGGKWQRTCMPVVSPCAWATGENQEDEWQQHMVRFLEQEDKEDQENQRQQGSLLS